MGVEQQNAAGNNLDFVSSVKPELIYITSFSYFHGVCGMHLVHVTILFCKIVSTSCKIKSVPSVPLFYKLSIHKDLGGPINYYGFTVLGNAGGNFLDSSFF